MTINPTYRKSTKIIETKFISIYIYHMNPGGIEKPHYHDGIEIEFVLKGNCQTHKKHHLYLRKKGSIHEGINNSDTELVFINITIPAESESNTHYLN